jgi:dihydrofolate synthase/folylpolyglutamate synthase
MTYAQALAALDRRQETRIRLGLGRLRRVLARLGDPQEAYPSWHVAGTNGKGSTCAILDSALREAGLRVGLYTSPHLVDVRERIKVNGVSISPGAFARHLARVIKADLSYFELLTAVAFLHFRERKVSAAVLETGLGGRLDATNVIKNPRSTLITSIDYDHMDWLGGTLSKIAAEKAGILKKNSPAFCPPLPSAALSVIKRTAKRVGAPLTIVRPLSSGSVDWKRGRQRLGPYTLSLLGERQGRNVALARAALSMPEPVFKRALAKVRWPGRFEVRRLAGGRTLILDGAHNPEAMDSLVRTLRRSPWGKGRLRWILGLLRDKDAKAIVARARPLLRDVVAVRPPSPRALEPLALARLVGGKVSVEPSAAAALSSWRRDPKAPKTAVVAGSFYLVGQAKEALS